MTQQDGYKILTAELSTTQSSKEEITISLKRSEDAIRRKEKRMYV